MRDNETNNQQLLTDHVLGRLDPQTEQQLRRRIEAEPQLKRACDDIRNTFSAMELGIQAEPPANLVAQTMARIRSAKQTDALLAREQLTRRDVIRPTFSIREIAAVAAIVLMIGAIFGVSFREADRRRQRIACAQNVSKIGAAIMSYANRNEGHLPSTAATNDRWLPTSSQPAASNSKALFRLIADGYLQPPTFQCPAVGGGSFAVRAGMTDFPAGKFVGYSYQHSIGPMGLSIEDKRIEPVREHMAILADSSPVFSGGRVSAAGLARQASDNHDQTGQNVLYLDMHAEFKVQPAVGVGGDNIFLADGVTDYKGNEKPTGPTDSLLLPAWSPETEAVHPRQENAPPSNRR